MGTIMQMVVQDKLIGHWVLAIAYLGPPAHD
jgi:hypothetical protein